MSSFSRSLLTNIIIFSLLLHPIHNAKSATCDYTSGSDKATAKSNCEKYTDRRWDCTTERCIVCTADDPLCPKRIAEDYTKCEKSDQECLRKVAINAAMNEGNFDEVSTEEENFLQTMGPGLFVTISAFSLASIFGKEKRKTDLIKGCLSPKIFLGTSVFSLFGCLGVIFKFKADIEDAKNKTIGLGDDLYKNMVKVFEGTLEIQNSIAESTEKIANIFLASSIGYAATGVAAIWDLKGGGVSAVQCQESVESYKEAVKKGKGIQPSDMDKKREELLDLEIEEKKLRIEKLDDGASMIFILMPNAYAAAGGVGVVGGIATEVGAKVASDMILGEDSGILDKVLSISRFTEVPTYLIWLAPLAGLMSSYLAKLYHDQSKQAKKNADLIRKVLAKFKAQGPTVLKTATKSSSTSTTTPAKTTAKKYSSTKKQEMCFDIRGNADPGCTCKKKIDPKTGQNTCMKSAVPRKFNINLGSATPTFTQGLAALGKTGDKMFAGDYSTANLGMNGNVGRLAKANRELADQTLENLNKELKNQGKQPLVVDDKLLARMVNKTSTPEVKKALALTTLGDGAKLASGTTPSSKTATPVDLKKLAQADKTKKKVKPAIAKQRRRNLFNFGRKQYRKKTSSRRKTPRKRSSGVTRKALLKKAAVGKQGISIFEIISRRYVKSGYARLSL